MCFPHSSVGKESACGAGDPSSIPGSGRSAGERIGYSLLYSLAFLVAQLVKNPPAMWETWVRPLGWEDPLGEGMVTHSCSCLENPRGQRSLGAAVPGVALTTGGVFALIWLAVTWVYIYIKVDTCTLKMSVL